MFTSAEGVGLIKGFEGCRLEAYSDAAGVWTIGYGHTGGVKEGDVWTQEHAENAFLIDLYASELEVNKDVKVPLNQHQFDALVDFTFNVGTRAFRGSTLLKLLNAGNYDGAAKEVLKWDHVHRQVNSGLLRRRIADEGEFLGQTGEENA